MGGTAIDTQAPRFGRVRRLGAGGVDGTRQPTVGNERAVRAALFIDRAMARLGLARPLVLVSGFWRSGTTWVQECLAEALGAKTVFEPLSPNDARRRAMLDRAFAGDKDAVQAYIPGPGVEGAAFWTFLDEAVTGRYGGRFLLSCRARVGESLRRGVVVKDVRLQFNLGAFHARYGVPVIHVRRHPCAVVASLLAADWDWTFGRVRLVELMRGLADRLPPGYPIGEDLLAEFDTDALSRIAAAWAVTERFADLTLSGEPWARTVDYESLVADPERRFAELCTWIGRKQVRVPAYARASASAHGGRVAPMAHRRRERWRQTLSAAEVARVVEVVTCLYPECASDLARTV